MKRIFPHPSAELYTGYITAAAILNASFLWLLNENIPLFQLSLSALPGILLAWCLLGSRNALFRFALPSLLVLGIIGVQERQSRFEDLIGREHAGAEIIAECIDPSLCGGEPGWMKNAPYHTTARLISLRFTPDAPWTAANGKLFLRLSRQEMPFKPGYGDICQFSGSFERIELNAEPGGFDFSTYARTRGIHTVFNVQKAFPRKKGKSWSRKIFDWRGQLLTGLGEGMSNESARNMAAALLFGMKQGIDSGTRNDFLRSGTIHVLSVSGLHVGLFFCVLLIFFRFLPYAARWTAILIPVGIYAYSTGMQGPAFRAFVMLGVWCVLKAFLWKTNALNTVAFAAVLLMLLNPAIPLDIGFQYSFLCVIFLLYSSDFIARLRRTLSARWKYSLSGTPRVHRWLTGFLSVMLAASVVAWLASFGISMLHQGLFSPYSVPAFLVMSPFAWLSFAIFAVAAVFSWIPGCLPFFGMLLQPVLLTLKGISAFFGRSGFYYTMPSPWIAVVLTMLLLLIFLRLRNPRRLAVCLLLLVFLTAGMFLGPLIQRDEILLVSGGAGRPMLILSSARASHAVVINIPDYQCARIASGYLKTRSTPGVETVFFDTMRKESCGGAYSFLNQLPAGELVFPGRPKRNTIYALAASQAAQERKIMVTDTSSVIGCEPDGRGIHLTCSGLWRGLHIRIHETESGGYELTFQKNGKAVHRFVPLSAEKRIERIRL